MSKKYNIFISHSWAYGDAYDKLICMLKAQGLDFKDYSVPKNDPLHTNGTDKQLYEAIKAKIAPIMAGVYASYSKWIDKEIEISTKEFSNRKKIIAIEPWGAEKTSAKVKKNADKIVRWNSSSIVSAIKELG